LTGRDVLLAWSKPLAMPFTFTSDARITGNALLLVPLQFERPARGEKITIPSSLVPYHRMLGKVPTRPLLSGNDAIEMLLRFQLPREVLPFKVEQARLSARILAPARTVTLAGKDGDKEIELRRLESPLDPIRLDITEQSLLRLDADGGLYLNVVIGKEFNQAQKNPTNPVEKWTIDYLEMEVSGRSEG
jgi:hypothetical protein